MSDTFSKVEVITGVARRRRFSTELKLVVVAETMQPGMSVSNVARRHGLSPSLVANDGLAWSRGRRVVGVGIGIGIVALCRRVSGFRLILWGRNMTTSPTP